MISQAPYVVARLGNHVGAERIIIGRWHAPAKHEVLPHQQAKFIGHVEEFIALVIAATPAAQEVHVCVARRLQDTPQLRLVHTRLEHIERYAVRAFGEDGNAVDIKIEALALVVRIAAQGNTAQAGAGARFPIADLNLKAV